MMLAALFVDKTLIDLVLPAVVAVLVFVAMFFLARRQSRSAPSIRTEVRERIESVQPGPNRDYEATYSSSYETPLFLLLGPANSGHSSILRALKEVLPGPERGRDSGSAPDIVNLESGAVLSVDADVFAGAADSDDDSKEWKKFLDRLHKRRPARPLDGVILTLPCNELVGQDALSPEKWQQRAAQMSKNLRLIRERLGFCFPVYVLVTRCHSIRGFREFAGAQLHGKLRQIFGWSNPYTLDASFDSEWVKQAFVYLRQVIEQQRAHYFAHGQNSGDGKASQIQNELFLFPVSFQELETPLGAILKNLFSNAGHRDALQFRGIYFSGQGREEGIFAGEEHPVEVAEFTPDLFEHKIFAERGLARPVDTTLAPRNQMVYSAKAICIVTAVLLFAGAAIAWRNLSNTQQKAGAHLKDFVEVSQKSVKPPCPEPAYDAIYVSQALSGSNFQSPLQPFSLIAGLDPQLQETMKPVFRNAVYHTLEADLNRGTEDLLKDPPGASSAALERLGAFVRQLLLQEEDIVLYNRLAKNEGNGREMLTLAGDLAPCYAGLPRRESSEMDAIVRNSPGTTIDAARWNTSMERRLEELVTGVLSQRMNERQLLQTVDSIQVQINELQANVPHTYEKLKDLDKSLGEAQTELAAKDLSWAAQDPFTLPLQLPQDLQGVLRPVFLRSTERNVLLCDENQPGSCTGLLALRSFIEEVVRAYVGEFRNDLLARKTKSTDNLIAVTDGKLQLSPTAARLHTALDSLIKLPFVAHETRAHTILDMYPAQQLLWDKSKLDEALQDKAAYDKFFNEDLANAPDDLQNTLESVALDRLRDNMADAIDAAQKTPDKPDPDPMVEAHSFAEAEPSLVKLLDQFGEVNFDQEYQALLQVSTRHALALLSRTDLVFESRNFYWPPARSFDGWSGETTPSASAYQANSTDEMLGYLMVQRQNLQSYIAAAKPLAAFLQERGPQSRKPAALIAKWTGIVNDAQKYEAAPESSSLKSLESYLATELDKTEQPDCQTPAAPSATAYFAQTQRSLEQAVAARCRFLLRHKGTEQYSSLAKFFNERLKNKFPFADPNPKTENPTEADPADVARLFQRLDADNKAIHESLQNTGGPAAKTAAMAAFVKQLESARPLFAALLSDPAAQGPIWDFVPVFRTNQRNEINGNQIIDWTLLVGNTTFHNSEPPRTGQWVVGEPVTLTLRWAKDSPNTPAPAAPPTGNAAAKSAVFTYHDPWALLKLLAQHPAYPDDIDRKTDLDPQTLVFTMNQQLFQEPGSNGRMSSFLPERTAADLNVRVFVTIRLYPPGKTTPLRLPVFPTSAPE